MKETDTREYGGSAVNVIAQGTQLQGNMITASDCRIDGALRGNIETFSIFALWSLCMTPTINPNLAWGSASTMTPPSLASALSRTARST